MKESIIRRALLIFLICQCLLTGFFIGRKYPPAHLAVHPGSIFEQHKREVWQRTIDAVVTLRNCKPFRQKWPIPYKDFAKFIRKDTIALGYDESDRDNLAYSQPLNSTIWVTFAFFMQSPDEEERTIAHELLHIVGLPDHAKPLDPSKDAIYRLTDECYPDLPPEANDHER